MQAHRVRYPIIVIGIVIGCALALSTPQPGLAQTAPLSVEQLVNTVLCRAYLSFYPGKNGRAQTSMTITDRQGRKRERHLTILRRGIPASGSCAEQKYYLYFHRPADVNKTTFMVWTHIDRDDDRWMYLPALDLVKRIAASDERTSFIGSHFYYEDVAGRGIDQDRHELLETTDNYYVLKSTPKQPNSVEFASFTMWIHRQSLIPVKVEYTDKQGEIYRVFEVLKVETIQDYPTVVQSRMRDLRQQGETTITYHRVQFDLDLPDTIFTERYLRQPPRTYLQ